MRAKLPIVRNDHCAIHIGDADSPNIMFGYFFITY